jgi:hypothetical protein
LRSIRQQREKLLQQGRLTAAYLYLSDDLEVEIRVVNSSGASNRLTLTRAEDMGLIFIQRSTFGSHQVRLWVLSSKAEIYINANH